MITTQKTNLKSIIRGVPTLAWMIVETIVATLIVVAGCLYILDSLTSAKIICAIGVSRLVSILVAEAGSVIRRWAE